MKYDLQQVDGRWTLIVKNPKDTIYFPIEDNQKNMALFIVQLANEFEERISDGEWHPFGRKTRMIPCDGGAK